MTVPFFPAEDSKLRATSLTTRRGGNCPNSLEVLQQLLSDDIKPYLVSCLPSKTSPATRRVIESYGPASSIDLQHCIHRERHTEAASSYIIRSEQTGSRTLVNYNDLPEMTVHEFERVALSFGSDQETWWHFEISVEVEKPGREGLPELAAEADVVFYSRTWAENGAAAESVGRWPCVPGEQKEPWRCLGPPASVFDVPSRMAPVREPSSRRVVATDRITAYEYYLAKLSRKTRDAAD
ncbi:hypothetical protein ACO1O0_009113 [Amphichorda felina]